MKNVLAFKSRTLLGICLTLAFANSTPIHAGTLGDEAAKAALDSKAATDAANAAAAQKEKDRKAKAAEEAARQAAADRKAEVARKAKAEADRQAKAEAERVAGLQRKCERNGGDWKRGKCVMPPPPKPVVVERKPQPASAPAPVVEPVPIVSSSVIAPQMVNIPAGTFTMGCKDGRDNVEGVDKCYGNEIPAHEVTLDAFQLGKYEVTFDEWDLCTQDGVCPKAEDEGWGRGKRPVINVSWEDTQTYIDWLNKRTGKGYRLPTEAEWEYASRAGRNDTAYAWGYAVGEGNANCYNGHCHDAFEYTAPVGSFAANAYGLYDMHGNVWEWCQDWYGDYSSSSASNPQGAESGAYRVLRGGSWNRNAQYVRSASRDSFTQSNRSFNVGFRLAHP